jgi:drug/metabolite transporter (DMT)-like permease
MRVAAVSTRMPRLGILLLVIIALGWGTNWPAMKIALEDMPPWTFRLMCVAFGGMLLLALTALRGDRIAVPLGRVPALALVSLLNVTGWQMFSAFGLLQIGSGRAAIIAFTMPLWASALGVFVLGERPGAQQMLALGFGLCALALLLGQDIAAVGSSPVGGLLMLGSALSWATGTVLVKRFDWTGMPVTALVGWQLLLGGIPVLIGTLMFEGVADFTAFGPASYLATAYAVGVGMVLCTAAFFKLVTLVPAGVAATGTLAVPVVGVISSALVLGEHIGLIETTALALVVSGLFLLVWGSEARA